MMLPVYSGVLLLQGYGMTKTYGIISLEYLQKGPSVWFKWSTCHRSWGKNCWFKDNEASASEPTRRNLCSRTKHNGRLYLLIFLLYWLCLVTNITVYICLDCVVYICLDCVWFTNITVFWLQYNYVYMLGFKCLDCAVNLCFHWLISRWIVLF
jgi:hypothetical protein